MPSSPSKLPAWFHTTAVLRGRAGPSTSSKVKYVRPKGYNLYLRKVVVGGGRTWYVSQYGTHYAAEFLKPGKAPTNKVASPTGGPKGYPYGVKDSRYRAKFHTGQDYPASTGTRIVAVKGGTVRRASWDPSGYGNYVIIDDGDHEWLYAHQSKIRVRTGQKVKAGQRIGDVGATGNVTGPHLHLEKSCGRRWSYGSVQKPTW